MAPSYEEEDKLGCCLGTVLFIAFGLAIWAAATPSWFVYYPAWGSYYAYAVSGPFVLSQVGNWGATVSVGGQAYATSTSGTSWKDAESLQPCSNVTFNNGLTMLGWGIDWGVCDTNGSFLGTPAAIVALQALVIITACFTCFAVLASVAQVSDGIRSKGLHATMLYTFIALGSSIASFSIVLAAVPWYSDSLRGDEPVIPISVLSLQSGSTFLYPLRVPDRFRLGAGFGCTVTVSILCLTVLAGFAVTTTQRSRNKSHEPAPASPQGAEAAAAAAVASTHGSPVLDPEAQLKDKASNTPEVPQDVTAMHPESQPKSTSEKPQDVTVTRVQAAAAAEAPPAAVGKA
jgi:hypothetical protein